MEYVTKKEALTVLAVGVVSLIVLGVVDAAWIVIDSSAYAGVVPGGWWAAVISLSGFTLLISATLITMSAAVLIKKRRELS